MKNIFLLLLVLLSNFANAQTLPDPFTLKIKATTQTPSNEFTIDITKQGDNLKLIYGLRDSISYRLDRDKNYLALNNLIIESFATASRDSLAKLGAKQDSMRSLYSVYSRDSISLTVSEATAFIDILNRVNKTGNVELTNASANAARNMREGPVFSFKIITPSQSRLLYAQYPTASTNPLLYQLITESLKLYREKKKNTFLDKRRTNNY